MKMNSGSIQERDRSGEVWKVERATKVCRNRETYSICNVPLTGELPNSARYEREEVNIR